MLAGAPWLDLTNNQGIDRAASMGKQTLTLTTGRFGPQPSLPTEKKIESIDLKSTRNLPNRTKKATASNNK